MSYIRCNSASGGGGGIDFSEVDALGTNEALCYAHWDKTWNSLGTEGKRTISNIKSYTYSRFQSSANGTHEYFTIIFDPKKCDVFSMDSQYKIRASTSSAELYALGVKDGEITFLGYSMGANTVVVEKTPRPYLFDYIILTGDFYNYMASGMSITVTTS